MRLSTLLQVLIHLGESVLCAHLPAFRHSLESTDVEVVRSTLQLVGRWSAHAFSCGPSAALSEITSCAVASIGSEDVLIRWAAVSALEQLLPLRTADCDHLRALICHASDRRPDVRRAVLAVLATLGVEGMDHRATAFAALSDGDANVRRSAVNTLAAFSDSVRAALACTADRASVAASHVRSELYEDAPWRRRVRVADSSADNHSASELTPEHKAHMAALATGIVALLDHPEEPIVVTAVAALAKIAPFARAHVGRIARLLRSENALVRRSALLVLAEAAADVDAVLALEVCCTVPFGQAPL
jgi:hypothetical protein